MEKQLKLNEKLDLILKNLNDEQVNKNIDTLMEMFLQKRLILTKIDLLKVFGIKLTTFNELQQAITRKETSRVEIQKIQKIMNKINSYNQVIAMVNDKSIKSGGYVSKNAMSYILKQDNQDQQLVIINVSSSNSKTKIDLDKLTKDPAFGEYANNGESLEEAILRMERGADNV